MISHLLLLASNTLPVPWIHRWWVTRVFVCLGCATALISFLDRQAGTRQAPARHQPGISQAWSHGHPDENKQNEQSKKTGKAGRHYMYAPDKNKNSPGHNKPGQARPSSIHLKPNEGGGGKLRGSSRWCVNATFDSRAGGRRTPRAAWRTYGWHSLTQPSRAVAGHT
mgnify:CR=1 FL=1